MLVLRKLLCLFLISLVVFSSSAVYAYSSEVSDKSIQAFEEMTDEYMKKVIEEYHVAGAAISVVKDGKVFFKKGYGYADFDKKAPVDPDRTAFQIASVSKLFTATAVMQQVEQGKLSLNEDVNIYLKDFKINNPFSKPVTLENLLTHTGGFDDKPPLYIKSVGNIFFDSVEPLKSYLKREMPPVIKEPGTSSQYSVFGMALAGYIVEAVSGVPFEQYVTENILKPLGMSNSSYGLNKEILQRAAKPYKYSKEKYIEGSYRIIYDHPSGSIYSSASDMANFMLMQLDSEEFNGVRVLEKSSIDNMQKQHYPTDEKLSGFGLGFYEIMRNGHRTVEHGGYLPSFSSKLTLMPEQKLGLFIAINTDSRDSGKVCNEFIDKFYSFFTSKGIDYEAEAALKSNIPLDMDIDKVNGAYVFDAYGLNDLSKLKSVLLTCNVKSDKAGNLMFNAEGIKWSYKYVGSGLFYSQENGMYCKLTARGNRMVLSILGMDFEKVNRADANLFKAAIMGLPILLAAIIVLVISILRKHRIIERRDLRLRCILLISSILITAFYILTAIYGLKSMMADTYIVIYVLTPMIKLTCYLSLFFTIASWTFVIDSWRRYKQSVWVKGLYALVLTAATVNLLFMYIMNGFRL